MQEWHVKILSLQWMISLFLELGLYCVMQHCQECGQWLSFISINMYVIKVRQFKPFTNSLFDSILSSFLAGFRQNRHVTSLPPH